MITYKSLIEFREYQLEKLFKAVDWESANYPQKLHLAISNSERVVSAWEKEELIGLISAISDGGMNVFFPYLLVHPNYQGIGIGKRLIEIMLKYYKNTYRKILVCNKEKIAFYEKCGFKQKEKECPMMIINL